MKVAVYDSIPNDLVEKIMHDANHIYFGSDNYSEMIMNLYKELEEHHITVNKTEWYKEHIYRLLNHNFHTQTANKLKKNSVDKQVNTLKLRCKEIGIDI